MVTELGCYGEGGVSFVLERNKPMTVFRSRFRKNFSKQLSEKRQRTCVTDSLWREAASVVNKVKVVKGHTC